MSDEIDLTRYPPPPDEQPWALALKILVSLMPYGSGPASLLLSVLVPATGKVQIAWLEYLGLSLLDLREQVDIHKTRLDNNEIQLQVLDQALNEYVERQKFWRLSSVQPQSLSATRNARSGKCCATSSFITPSPIPLKMICN